MYYNSTDFLQASASPDSIKSIARECSALRFFA